MVLGWVVLAVNILAFGVLVHVTRGKTVVHLWLCVAMLASLLEVALTFFTGNRFTLGWYVARISSLTSAGVVLCSLLYEASNLYAQLAHQERETKLVNQRLQESWEKLNKLSREDGLTGLLNRRVVMQLAQAQLARWLRTGRPFSVVLVDIDDFKPVNDRYGHLVGDSVLQFAADVIRSAARATDYVGRYGGEEFVLLLPQTASEEAFVIAQHLVEAVQKSEYEGEDLSLRLTVSAGTATADPSDRDLLSLIARADTALYAAKKQGKNRAIMSDPGNLANRIRGLPGIPRATEGLTPIKSTTGPLSPR
jgi:diguanylate cyclase (GGDEF)-like protein